MKLPNIFGDFRKNNNYFLFTENSNPPLIAEHLNLRLMSEPPRTTDNPMDRANDKCHQNNE
jgi:hypothetical protein